MASSKTLTPTNVTISIPAMTDVPDASVFSNCVDKEADAINALNSKMTPETVTVINGACYLSAIDKICILNIGGSIQAPTGSQTTIATLDTNYRPTRTTYGVVAIEGGSSNKYALVAITTGGVITIYNYSGTSANYLYGSIMFVR